MIKIQLSRLSIFLSRCSNFTFNYLLTSFRFEIKNLGQCFFFITETAAGVSHFGLLFDAVFCLPINLEM